MASKEKLVPLTIRVPDSYIERLEVLSGKLEVDRTEVARRAIRNGIEDIERGAKIAENPLGEKLLLLSTLFEGSADERAEMTRAIRTVATAKKASKGSGGKPSTA